MNTSKKNIGLTNGWILCPSKSFPGKFYYFNVLNGEAAWSLNDADNKDFKKESSIHRIADKSHNYPEPASSPDNNSVLFANIGPNYRKLDIQSKNIPYTHTTQQLPQFGQVSFPKYVANTEPLMPNIVWTPIQLPMPMFCQDTKRPMMDQVTQTSEIERELFTQTCDIPLCKRFKNYEKPSLVFDNKNHIIHKPRSNFGSTIASNFAMSTPVSKFGTSTRISKLGTLDSKFGMSSKRRSMFEIKPNSLIEIPKLIKEPTLKLQSEIPFKIPDMVKSPVTCSIKSDSVKSPVVPKVSQSDAMMNKLESTDLRFLLLAKRRMSLSDMDDGAAACKKAKLDIKPTTPKKRVTFDVNSAAEDTSMSMSGSTAQKDYIPLSTSPSPILNFCIPKELPSFHKKNKEVLPSILNDAWYIVADTDVLLLEYKMIETLVLSDSKCVLLFPHTVKMDIEALCMGDCRGQQRVINARLITRRLAAPPPHYRVEPPPEDYGNVVVTTDSILNCCLRAIKDNHHVVLITNDPYLNTKASSLNIPSYKLNEIKNGVNIRPDKSSELKKIKISFHNEDTIINNRFMPNTNFNLFSNANKPPVDVAKKQLFLSTEERTQKNVEDCDIMVNLTKSNIAKTCNTVPKCDNYSNFDINKEVQNLNLKESILKPMNENRNTSLSRNTTDINLKENNFVIEKTIQNSNAFNFETTIPIQKSNIQSNHDTVNTFQNHVIKKNNQDAEKVLCSIPISNIAQINFQTPIFDNSHQPINMKNAEISGYNQDPNVRVPLQHYPHKVDEKSRPRTATQSRLNKIFSTMKHDPAINTQKNKLQNQNGLFKMPQPLLFKNRPRNTSALAESLMTTDKIRAREIKTSELDINERFCIKSKFVDDRIKFRMDEWFCVYIQIVEDMLNDILQKNRVCMKNTAAPVTLHDMLICLKMLYGSHTTVRDTADYITEVLNKYTCEKGKFKLPTSEDFMQLLRYGVLLTQWLKEVLPHSEELKDAETRFDSLLSNMESTSTYMDPELLKTPIISRSDIDDKNADLRPNFIKHPSYIVDYLKKHYKDWSAYKEDLHGQYYNNNKIDHFKVLGECKVVRTFGRNLNMLKFDSSKTISLTKAAAKDDSAFKTNDKPKLIRFLDNNLNKPEKVRNTIEETTVKYDAGPKMNKMFHNSEFLKDTLNQNSNGKADLSNFNKVNEIIKNNEEQNGQRVIKLTEALNQNSMNETKIVENVDLLNTENMEIEENSDQIVIKNIKLLDEYENKFKEREVLDLDLLDYSDIYEPSLNESSQSLVFEIISQKKYQNNLENNTHNNDNKSKTDEDYGLTNKVCTIDFTEDDNFDSDQFYTPTNYYESNIEQSYTYINKVDTDIKTEPRNYCVIADSNIEETPGENPNSEIENINNHNIAFHDENNTPNNINIETVIDTISANHEESLAIARDDSANDSGFENDSTQAHSIVKIFLNELSTTYTVIIRFVNNFLTEIRGKELSDERKHTIHDQASKALENMIAIVERLRCIIRRESAEETVLKTLLLKAGVEATSDKRITRYRQIAMKSLEQAQILENALRIVLSTTIGDFEAISTNAASNNSNIRYLNIFE